MNPAKHGKRSRNAVPLAKQSPERLTVPIPEAGLMLGVSRSTLYVLVSQGHLKAVKVGGRTLITTASIRSLVDGLPEASIRRTRQAAA